MKKRNKIFLSCISAFVIAFSSLFAGAHAVEQNNPLFDEPMPSVSRLTVILPKGNPFDQKPAPIVEDYTVKLSVVKGIDVSTEAGYRQARGIKFDQIHDIDIELKSELVTDAEGKADFGKVPAALYLVEALAPEGRSDAIKINPTLLVLPATSEDGTWSDGVELTLKREIPGQPKPPPEIPNPQPEPKPSPKPHNPLAKTGVSVAGLASVGVATMAVGILVARKKESGRELR